MKAYVYVITHIATSRHYVGKTVDHRERWTEHRRIARHPHDDAFSKVHAALRKYGPDSFTFQVIEEHASEAEAFEAEAWWIEFLRSNVRGYGFNLDGGGSGGKKRCAETIEKLRADATANPRRYWLGKKVLPHMREALIAASKRNRRTEAEKQHIAAVSRERWADPEYKARVSEKLRAPRRPRGPQSPEWREKISQAHKANPMPTELVRERAHRGWETRRRREAERKLGK